jgi:magnesium chelatase family protein
MLARRLTPLLPAISLAEALETTPVHRIGGLTGDCIALVTRYSCQTPHHSILVEYGARSML